jgi:fermentation-respiration switch protein FrsA (DUF1100 family)
MFKLPWWPWGVLFGGVVVMKRGVVVLWLKGLSNWFMVKGKGMEIK